MKTPRYVIGLDGGGTKTAAELCDGDGTVLVSASGGPSNFQVIGIEAAARTIVDLIETCCHSIGCPISRIGSVLAGLTGAGRVFDQKRMAKGVRAEAKKRGFTFPKVSIDSDARIALEGAFSGGPGIIVIAGTGSIVFGKTRAGAVHRSGGWGRIIGDEGSGYALGRELFRSVAAQLDSRGPKTSLSSMIGREFGLRSQPDIIRALYKEGFDVASAAPLVTRAASRGDTVARSILESAAADLVNVIEPVVRRLQPAKGKGNIPLVFVGSLMAKENAFSAAVGRLLRKTCPRVIVRQADAAPVHGASLMALHSR